MSFGKHLKDMRHVMNLNRYQNKFMHKRRTVSEHMCSTAMISHWLVLLENKLFNNNADMGEVLQRAINHNITQAHTGNILHTTRLLSKSMDNATNNSRKISYTSFIEEEIPVSWRKDFERFAVNYKDSSIEGNILIAADIIDTILECVEEVKLHNNDPFFKILIERMYVLKDMNLDCVKYVFKYIIPSFGVIIRPTSDSIYGNLEGQICVYDDNLSNYMSNIEFSNDYKEIQSFSKIGEYIYEYRNLMELLRYQNKFMFERTSVVEHMWFVAKISQGLALWTEKKFNIKVDMANVLCRALAHDVNERVTGDILSTTKRMTELMKKAVEEMEELAFEEYILPSIPESERDDFTTYILYPKDETIEGKILAAADIIDTIFECSGEVALGNTEVFSSILKNVTKSLLNIKLEAVDYFLKYSLQDIGLDIKEAFGEEVYEYIKNIKTM